MDFISPWHTHHNILCYIPGPSSIVKARVHLRGAGEPSWISYHPLYFTFVFFSYFLFTLVSFLFIYCLSGFSEWVMAAWSLRGYYSIPLILVMVRESGDWLPSPLPHPSLTLVSPVPCPHTLVGVPQLVIRYTVVSHRFTIQEYCRGDKSGYVSKSAPVPLQRTPLCYMKYFVHIKHTSLLLCWTSQVTHLWGVVYFYVWSVVNISLDLFSIYCILTAGHRSG